MKKKVLTTVIVGVVALAAPGALAVPQYDYAYGPITHDGNTYVLAHNPAEDFGWDDMEGPVSDTTEFADTWSSTQGTWHTVWKYPDMANYDPNLGGVPEGTFTIGRYNRIPIKEAGLPEQDIGVMFSANVLFLLQETKKINLRDRKCYI